MGADMVQLGAKQGQKGLTAVAKVADDLVIKGSAISTAKTLRTLGNFASKLGNASGGIDAAVSTIDLVNTLVNPNATTGEKVSSATKTVVKTTILIIGFSNPITGAVLGVVEAFGGTDWLANKIGSRFD